MCITLTIIFFFKVTILTSRPLSGLCLAMAKTKKNIRATNRRSSVVRGVGKPEFMQAKVDYYGPSSSQPQLQDDYYGPSSHYKYADAYDDLSNSNFPQSQSLDTTTAATALPVKSRLQIHTAKRRKEKEKEALIQAKLDVAANPCTESPQRNEPVIPPILIAPSESYLALSQEQSLAGLPSDAPRKLLILDLNGTLLIRSARSQPGRLRNSNPRPYLPSLVAYLFHDTTRAWLDTMVWSSAMPHSVADMVLKAFPDQYHRQCLQAVWARDELGLRPEDYGSFMNCRISSCVPNTCSRQKNPDNKRLDKALVSS